MSDEWAAVQVLLGTIRGAGLNADVNLEDVDTPGVWVQLRSLDLFSLAGGAVTVRLVGITGDVQADIAYPKLIDLFRTLDQAIEDAALDGTFVTVTTPDGDDLPGIAVTYQLVP